MIKDFLQSIAGLGFFAIIFLLLIFSSFLVVLVYVIKMNKNDLNRYSQMPLDNSDIPETVRIPVGDKNDTSGE